MNTLEDIKKIVEERIDEFTNIDPYRFDLYQDEFYDRCLKEMKDIPISELTDEDYVDNLLVDIFDDLELWIPLKCCGRFEIKKEIENSFNLNMKYNSSDELIGLSLGAEYLCDIDEIDFYALDFFVKKSWLYEIIKKDKVYEYSNAKEIKEFLRSEYTWDDTCFIYQKALDEGEIIAYYFS